MPLRMEKFVGEWRKLEPVTRPAVSGDERDEFVRLKIMHEGYLAGLGNTDPFSNPYCQHLDRRPVYWLNGYVAGIKEVLNKEIEERKTKHENPSHPAGN